MSEPEKLERGLGLIEATSLNMTFMVGIGPFIVIPFIIRAMGGGPQCILAWVVGAALAAFDGCVWAELGAAMPQAGGSYVFLREAYGANRWGRLMSFLFIWQTLFQAPLSISSGALGFADYSRYLVAKLPGGVAWLNAHALTQSAATNYNRAVAAVLIGVAVALLYRRITAIGKISTALWVIVLGTILWLIYGGVTHFNASRVFTYPPGAWSFSWIFFAGLGHASVQTVYSYLGYYNVCNLGGEMKNPGKNIPRAIFISIFGIGILYVAMQTSILSVVPWQEAQNSAFVASLFVERTFGMNWATLATALILLVAFGSIFSATLGYSRVPYAAALDGNFFSIFARVHPTKRFPHVSLLALGATSIVVCLFFNLFVVIRSILAMRCLIQFVGQAFGLMLLHRRWRAERWPFRMWLYPVPVFIAIAGWIGIFISTGRKPMLASLAATVAGILVYLGRARYLRQWPFEEGRSMKAKRPLRRWTTILVALISPALAVMCTASQLAAQSLPDTLEAINKSRVTTRILFVTAHPDDEWSSLLTYLSRGLDADVGLLTITRGQGGQNAIGPEQGGQLGVVRTEELLEAGQHYGVKQFFTRAMDTGYVKSPEQAMKIWNGLALEDMVRVIRTYRPDVVINGWGGVHSGHGHHQASGILTPQAVAAAADPTKYPEQISEGLVAWKVKLEVRLARDSKTPGAVELPVNSVSPLWGKSYVEMGMEGHAQHRSQGTPAFFGNPFFRRPIFLVAETEKGDAARFDAKILAQPLVSLATDFPALHAAMAPRLSTADASLEAALAAAQSLDRTAAATSLAQAALEIGSLKREISKLDTKESPAAIWELERVSERIDRALADDVAIPMEAQASRHELVAGETFSVDVMFSGKPVVPVKWTLDAQSLQTPPGWTATPAEQKDGSDNTRFNIAIPAGAKAPSSPDDAIRPFPPPLVRVALAVEWNSYRFTIEQPVESMEATTTGIATYPLELVPAVTLTVEPQQVMVPARRASEPIKLLARVRYHGTKPAKVSVDLDAPTGWTAQPIEQLEFSSASDQLIRFIVTPPAQTAPGAYDLHPYARLGDATFRTSLEPIPTLPTRNWSEPSDATVHVLDLVVPASLRVGYIAAANDPLPEILRQLGMQVDLLDDVALAFGDLSGYDAITVGIRAYELRPDLIRANPRLLNYVERGGTLLVQYQRDFAWDKLLPAPFPTAMGDKVARVTDADSPVRFLVPDSPLLNSPNKITLADFQGWVQERGLYFWGRFDPRYQPLLGLKDFGEPEVNGSLVAARDGKGLYIYTGLSFFRELPAGVPGAYRLFVNLLSQTPHAAGQD